MQWTKVSVKFAELIFSDASDSVFRTYVRLMLLVSSMEVAPTSAQLSMKLGKRKMETLSAYLETKEISLDHIINKVMEDVESVLRQREQGKNRQIKHRVTRDVTEQDKIRVDKIREDTICTKTQIENLLTQFPTEIKSLVDEYLELAEKENKSGKIIESKRLRLITELYNAYNNCDQNKFKEALKITVQKEAPNINYIKAVYKGIEKKEGVGQKTRKEENEKEWKNGVRKGDNLYKRSQEYIKSIQSK